MWICGTPKKRPPLFHQQVAAAEEGLQHVEEDVGEGGNDVVEDDSNTHDEL